MPIMKSRTKSSSPTGHGQIVGGGGTGTSIPGHKSSSAAYPSISAAYWLPAPNPTPYMVPERKLFVGMLSKKYNEQDVRQLFSGNGAIDECTVLRDQQGQSKGCAFVTFAAKQSAVAAIKALHQSQTMEGCSAPLVVKFADTQKDKDMKKMHQLQQSLWGMTPAAATGPTGTISPPAATLLGSCNPMTLSHSLTQSAATMATPILPNPPQSPYLANDATSLQFLHHPIQGIPPILSDNSTGLLAMQNLFSLNTSPSSPNSLAAQGEALYASSLPSQLGGSPYSTASSLTGSLSLGPVVVAGKQTEGPEGCNLFIYHLPQEFTDADLATTFVPFGNIISAKVFIDKQTNLSKCFGFVSYDNPTSAQAAIQAMHGFQIGTKRLKVQLKRSKEAAKPY